MITIPTIRSVVCPISIPPAAFPIQNFAHKLELGKIEQQVQVPQYALWEYEDLRLQIFLDRLQLGFREKASSEFVRTALEEYVRLLQEDFQARHFSFNANLRLQPEDGEPDPTANALDAEGIVERLGGSNPRGGIWLVYEEGPSIWWLELIPDVRVLGWWIFSIQRNIADFPDDEDERAVIFNWFEHSESELAAQCRVLMTRGD